MKSKYGFETTSDRSRIMARIHGTETREEVKLRKALWSLGYRYRKNVGTLPGKPDIVLRKYMLVIFVDGEFWHGHQWTKKKARIKTNREYWIPKIERNIARDKLNNRKLREMGFTVLRFWEREVKSDLPKCLRKIAAHISHV